MISSYPHRKEVFVLHNVFYNDIDLEAVFYELATAFVALLPPEQQSAVENDVWQLLSDKLFEIQQYTYSD
jgi:hypothetical protein